jgi:hypothetical protein
VTKIPTELQQINKRSVRLAMEIMGMCAAIRAGSLGRARKERDAPFGDFRGRTGDAGA